jgi:hypothetical protein
MTNKLLAISTGVILAVVLIWNLQEKSLVPRQDLLRFFTPSSTTTGPSSSSPSMTPAKKTVPEAKTDLPPWETQFENIVQDMQTLSEDPEEADRKMTELANSLTDEQLGDLTNTVLSKQKNGDQKLLATELLARSPRRASMEQLKTIILTPAQEISKIPALQQEQRAFQMLAIEGLASKTEFRELAHKDLHQLTTKVSDTVLLDRLHRSLWSMAGQAPTPEKQDRTALQELLRHE